MLSPTFAIVDHDTTFASRVAGVAPEHGFTTRQMHTVADAGAWLPANDPELVLVDMSPPDGSGFDVLHHLTPAHRGQIGLVTGSALINVIPHAARFPCSIEEGNSVNFRVGMSWRDVEAEMLRQTLAFQRGDKTAAAGSLGVSVRTIHNHLGRND